MSNAISTGWNKKLDDYYFFQQQIARFPGWDRLNGEIMCAQVDAKPPKYDDAHKAAAKFDNMAEGLFFFSPSSGEFYFQFNIDFAMFIKANPGCGIVHHGNDL